MNYTFGQLIFQMADRKRTNAEIDLLNSYLKEGETPLPYETEDNNPPELSDEEKLAAEQKIKDDAAAAQKIIDDAEAEKNKVIIPTAEVELDDEKVLAYIKKKEGKETLTSLDELLNPKKELTEEEKKAAIEKRDADKFAFGLTQGLFSKKQLEEFITDTKNTQDLVYAAYHAEQKAKDPELKDADIKAEFEEKFGLDLEDRDSRQAKVGETLLNNIADSIIRKKHSKILNLDNDYSSYETTQAKQKENETKFATQAPVYKKDVEQIRSEIKKVSFQISKDEVFETELDDDIVEGVITNMLEDKFLQKQIAGGWSKESIKQLAQTSSIMQQFPKIMKSYADKVLLSKQAGTRGIPPEGRKAQVIPEGQLTEDQKKAIGFMKGEQTLAN